MNDLIKIGAWLFAIGGLIVAADKVLKTSRDIGIRI